LTDTDAILDEFSNHNFRKNTHIQSQHKRAEKLLGFNFTRAAIYRSPFLLCKIYTLGNMGMGCGSTSIIFEIKCIDSPSLMQLRIQFFSPEGMLFGYLI